MSLNLTVYEKKDCRSQKNKDWNYLLIPPEVLLHARRQCPP